MNIDLFAVDRTHIQRQTLQVYDNSWFPYRSALCRVIKIAKSDLLIHVLHFRTSVATTVAINPGVVNGLKNQLTTAE